MEAHRHQQRDRSPPHRQAAFAQTMSSPAAAPAAMRMGSGTLKRQLTTRVATAIRTVGRSMSARRASTKEAPAMAPVAAAVTPATKARTWGCCRRTSGTAHDEEVDRKEHADRGGHRAGEGRDEVADEGHGDDHRSRGDHRHRHRVEELLIGRASRSWSTTPPCRKGTMARPLPKTKAPASAKYQAIVSSSARGCRARAGPRRVQATARRRRAATEARRRLDQHATTTPQTRKSQTISDSVQAVTPAMRAKSPTAGGPCARVIRTSL